MKIQVMNPMRFDQAVAHYFAISRTKAQKYITEGIALVNDQKKSASFLVKEGDVLTLLEKEEENLTLVKENIFVDIIYEDDDLLVVNKASGMVVHPAPGHVRGTLVNALLSHFSLSKKESTRPGIVHRLDKDTSGLMLVAKNDRIHELLGEMIAKKEVLREYLALVDGVIPNQTGTIHAPIGRDPKNREKMKVTDQNAKDAITHFTVLERYAKHTLIRCKLDTGRTHQIRVHLAYIGHPVYNDPLYGKEKKNTSFGQFLHSYHLAFTHPITGKFLEFEVAPPLEFQKKLQDLKSDIQ